MDTYRMLAVFLISKMTRAASVMKYILSKAHRYR